MALYLATQGQLARRRVYLREAPQTDNQGGGTHEFVGVAWMDVLETAVMSEEYRRVHGMSQWRWNRREIDWPADMQYRSRVATPENGWETEPMSGPWRMDARAMVGSIADLAALVEAAELLEGVTEEQ